MADREYTSPDQEPPKNRAQEKTPTTTSDAPPPPLIASGSDGDSINCSSYHDPQLPQLNDYCFVIPDWWILICAGVLIAVGVATAVIFYEQFREMGRQTRILNIQAQQAAADAIEANKQIQEQLRIARQQAQAAQDSAEAIRRQMRIDQRAWISVAVSFPQEFKENTTIFGFAHITNSGKTPAKNILGQFVIEKVRNGESPSFTYSSTARTIATQGSLFPNASNDVPVEWVRAIPRTSNMEPILLGPTDIADLRAGRIVFVIHGRIDYKDVFGMSHWIKACGGTSTPGSYTAKKCTDYNDLDNN
jgi:hypothetical protein